MIAWVSRQGAVVIQGVRDFTVKTVAEAADLAVQAGSDSIRTRRAAIEQCRDTFMRTSITRRRNTLVVSA